MFDSQVKIAERLTSLNLDEEVKQFFVHVMEFYKGHIKKLQMIIMTKQEEVDEALQLKNGCEERMADMQTEIERLQNDLRTTAEQTSRSNHDELELTIQSLKEDLNSRLFDKSVFEDTIRNLRAQNDSLKSQNGLILTQLNAAKAEATELRGKMAKTGSGVPEDLRKEISNLRADLNNVKNATGLEQPSRTGTTFYQKPPPETPRAEPRQEVPANDKPKRFYQRGGAPEERQAHPQGGVGQNSFAESKPEVRNEPARRPPVVNDDDRPLDVGRNRVNPNQSREQPVIAQAPPAPPKNTMKFEQMRREELEDYYRFLVEKDQDLQNKMWKLPSKAKSKIEKMEISEVRRHLENVAAEMEEVKAVLKR